MKIYTKTGDRGETGLLGPLRVSKSDPRIAAYGEVDELNAALGVVRAEIASARRERAPRARTAGAANVPDASIDRLVERIQSDLFVVGAMLATQPGVRLAVNPVVRAHVARLERAIDAATAKLPPLSSFILPGGTPLAAHLHLARTICRRAERAIVALAKKEEVAPNVIIYVNRLSDLLFVLARAANASAGVPDVAWRPRKTP